MDLAQQKPKARPVEPVSIQQDGERMIAIRDPERLSDDVLTLSPAAFWVVCLMNGKNSLGQIAEAFSKTFGTDIKAEELDNLVKMLDKAHFLENENFALHLARIAGEFHNNPVRPAALAGQSYPADKDELEKELDGYLDGKEADDEAPFALIAPHIDLRAGGDCFGAAYATMKNSPATTFVILGTGHTLTGDFFSCINKPFETPLGVSPTDEDFLNRLQEEFGEPLYDEAFAQRTEHSVEFQVLFLQKLFGAEDPPRKIVPILLSFPEDLDRIANPRITPDRVDRFRQALATVVEERDDVAVIAGIDMAHVGKRFGQEKVDEDRMQEVEDQDRRALNYLLEEDREGFVEYMKEVNPSNNVCGYPALYMLFDLLQGRPGELLDYSQSVEGENDSMVSFAAMRF